MSGALQQWMCPFAEGAVTQPPTTELPHSISSRQQQWQQHWQGAFVFGYKGKRNPQQHWQGAFAATCTQTVMPQFACKLTHALS
jgi:hypothetical protein